MGEEHTISLESLCELLKAAADDKGTKKANRILFLNTIAALRSLGEKVEDQDRELQELKNRPLLVGPGGSRVN